MKIFSFYRKVSGAFEKRAPGARFSKVPKRLRNRKNVGGGTWGFAVLTFFYCGDKVNKISTCGVAVISNPTVCDVCVFHAALFGEMKLFAVLRFFYFPLSNLNLALV